MLWGMIVGLLHQCSKSQIVNKLFSQGRALETIFKYFIPTTRYDEASQSNIMKQCLP